MGRKKKEKEGGDDEDEEAKEAADTVEEGEGPKQRPGRRASKPVVGKWATLGRTEIHRYNQVL